MATQLPNSLLMLLWSMPDVRPENRAFRDWFYARWGQENCIILARTHHAEYERYTQRLSIKMALGGTEHYFLDERTLGVDDDHYLILNDGRSYGSLLTASAPVESFSIFFRPGLLGEVCGAMRAPLSRWLDAPPGSQTTEFFERLVPHDTRVSPVLRFIRHHMRCGFDDEAWYEEQLHFLLERMLARQQDLRDEAAVLRGLKRSTRREIDRRLALAADFMTCAYERPLDLREIASHAYLSPHHFLRLFRQRFGLTPFQFLNRRRIQVARRLLTEDRLTALEVAERVGFSSRATYYRQLKRWASDSPSTSRL